MHRFEHLQQRIEDCHEINNQKLLKILKNIYHSELRRLAFKKLIPIIKGRTNSTLNRVITTDPVTNKETTITAKDELHKALIERNQNHFNQSCHTPFAQDPLCTLLPTFKRNLPVEQRLLQGDTSDFSSFNPIISELLFELKTLPDFSPMPFLLTDKEFIEGMQLAHEGKSSFMSGRHYSIYKALLRFPYTIRIITSHINDCITNKYVLSRWKKVVQIMLCKIPGNFHINKLRVMQLLEADLNMYLRLIWGKKLVRNALKHSLFRPEQLSSRPGFSGSSAPLLKVLSFDNMSSTCQR